MEVSEYMDFCNDPLNGLVKSQKIGPLEFKVIYKPLDLMILNHYRKNKISRREYNEAKSLYANAHYFDLKFSIKEFEKHSTSINNMNVVSHAELEERIHYLNDSFRDDIYLINGHLVNQPLLCHHERTYNSRPDKTFVTAFSKFDDNKDSLNLVVKSPIFNNIELMASFNNDQLENLPLIKLSN